MIDISDELIDEIFEFLDNLRESGTCNMGMAPIEIRENFLSVDKYLAREIFKRWRNARWTTVKYVYSVEKMKQTDHVQTLNTQPS